MGNSDHGTRYIKSRRASFPVLSCVNVTVNVNESQGNSNTRLAQHLAAGSVRLRESLEVCPQVDMLGFGFKSVKSGEGTGPDEADW